MRIGIDFDNTIACYDGVFRRAALERGLVPADIGQSKTAVRDHLRGLGRDDLFTELQGYVYRTRMEIVAPYEGFAAFLKAARRQHHEPVLISHKTRYPFRGPAYDLHAAARGFLAAHDLVGADAFAEQDIHFELTKEAKIARIAALACDVLIDDLPEILAMDGLPVGMRAILFDPEMPQTKTSAHPFETHASWASIRQALLDGPG